ncbi:fatty acid synthase-like isoform X2 [Vespa crabro]|uniref:fatty acid synthase-like isoform X2 n=2 Tax=Vespa crabro TaxID=7445 RepID=UPI001F01315D|nr:fatty acid synthase-like isoform X2 [Vespa crabro]
MGSQRSGMGQSLMRFPIFAKAIEKCDAVLKQYKLNIYKILTDKDNSMFDNILHSIVGNAAVQIGMVDLLTSVGVVPDYVIGYSVGELGCAYTDGCFTAEEMILAAYSRGMALIKTEIPHGSMATATEVIVEEVPCNNIPYHSRYIAAVGSKLFVYLKKVIPVAKPRSKKWLSTSVPQNAWSTSAAKLSSAEYHTNNLLKPVLFAETLALIPNNAVTIKIGSQNLLQATLTKSLQPIVRNIALNHPDDKDNVIIFLQALGKLYNSGIQLDLAKLYPHVEYPVSRGTPVISPLIGWKHSDDWFVSDYNKQVRIDSGERIFEISIDYEEFQYVSGHMIVGRNLFPATGYLCLVWETFGMMIGRLYTEVFVVIENVKFNRATTIPIEGKIEMIVMIQKVSFEEHIEHIKRVMKAIVNEGFKLKFKKCTFATESVKYLGHIIEHNTVRPVKDNLISIRNFPIPKTQKNIRQFLGKINFYHEYIPKSSILLDNY